MMRDIKAKPSLRNRAILYASIFAVVVIILTLLGYRGLNQVQDKLAQNRHERQLLYDNIRVLQGHLLETYRQLDNLLLEPEKIEYIDDINQSLEAAFAAMDNMQSHQSWEDTRVSVNIRYVGDELQMLKKEINDLIKIRMDITQVYPSLGVGSRIMRRNRINMNNYLSIIITATLEDKSFKEMDERFVRSLLNVRHLWTTMVSNFRVYMANRLGSFDKTAISTQESSIETIMGELSKEIDLLEKLDDTQGLDLEISDAISQMHDASLGWYQGFEQVKKIHASGEWRIDSKIMKEKISPRVNDIVTLLGQIESLSKAATERDLEFVGEAAQSPIIRLVYVTSLGLLLIIVLIVSLDRQVFRPIALVANAIRARALGRDEVLVPMANSFETYQLLDAFNEMNRRVQERQTELEYQALHDTLTTLPNRALLLNKFEHEIMVARRSENALSFLMIDLNKFKPVNDIWGHHIGDGLLIESALRMKETLREVDTISRLGGDEFCVLLPGTDINQSELVAKKIVSVMNEPFVVEGISLEIGCSIGIAVYPMHGDNCHDLMRNADMAMYTAKKMNIGYAVYNPEDDTVITDMNILKKDICSALKQEQIELVFQARRSISDNSLRSIEVSLQWQHPSHGMVPTEQIITLSEQADLVNELTGWTIDAAMTEVKCWGRDWRNIPLLINLPAQSIVDEELCSTTLKILEDHAMPSAMLSFGIPASAVMTRPVHTLEFMDKLANHNFSMTISNYGISTISSALLRKLPVSEISIDKSLISGIDKGKGDLQRIRSIVYQLHNIGIAVTAVAGETAITAELLKEIGFDYVQGGLFKHPTTHTDTSLL